MARSLLAEGLPRGIQFRGEIWRESEHPKGFRIFWIQQGFRIFAVKKVSVSFGSKRFSYLLEPPAAIETPHHNIDQ